MIKKLRTKFICASMLALALVLLVILGGINILNYRKMVSDADQILTVLGENRGRFPQHMSNGNMIKEPGMKEDRRNFLSPETPYESRFFSVLLDYSGTVYEIDTGRIAAVDDQTAQSYARSVLQWGKSRGFLEDYRYLLIDEAVGARVIFLDCGRNLSTFRATLLSSAGIAVLGLAAVLVLLIIFSGRIIKPVAESYEKQKRFITDAGHEIKTPLTIISADTDLAELECGESEWLADIKSQTRRLTELTDNLIYLSRMDEEQPRLQPIQFPISDVAEEAAQSFLPLAKAQNKELSIVVQPMLSCMGDEKSIRRLVSVLMDNALKYSPPGGVIRVSLVREGHSVRLCVSNTAAVPVDGETLNHLFDRFYRADQSRNSAAGGYGLGLSIARSIVAAHKGKIRVDSLGNDLTFAVTLPC